MQLISTVRMAIFQFLVGKIIKIRVTLVAVTADVPLACSPERMEFSTLLEARAVLRNIPDPSASKMPMWEPRKAPSYHTHVADGLKSAGCIWLCPAVPTTLKS